MHKTPFIVAAVFVGFLFTLVGCSTLHSSEKASPQTPNAQQTAQPSEDQVRNEELDPGVAHLYKLEAQIVASTWDWEKGALLDEAMTELVGLLNEKPDLMDNEEFRSVHRGLMAEYRRFHGYGTADTMETARGDIFAFRAGLFKALDKVQEPLLEDVMPAPDAERPETEVPLTTNRLVKRSITYLQKQPDKHVNKWLHRAGMYFPMIEYVLEEEGVPEEIKYLPMIESGLNPRARSWAGAVGMWQFVASTGREYGLTINAWVDERRDPEKATRAAARHLRDLYDEFGDWHLALAAYNCGAYCVKRALRRTDAANPTYWDAYRYLPRETRGYVPMYIAAALVASDPGAYGFEPVEPAPAYSYDYVAIRGSMLSLREIAQLAGTKPQMIRALNPELRRHTIPPSKGYYHLRIPLGSYERFATRYAALPDEKKRPALSYRVRRGDTLSEIAQRYGTTTRHLQRTNGIRGSMIRVGQQLVVPAADYESAFTENISKVQPVRVQYKASFPIQPIEPMIARSEEKKEEQSPFRKASLEVAAKETETETSKDAVPNAQKETTGPQEGDGEKASRPTTYRVRRGDTLSEIADRYGVRTRALRRWNGLRSSRINVGQTLHLTPTDAAESRSVSTYRVRRGDTLSEIADQFGTSVRAIRQRNGLSGSRIRIGQRLDIPAGATSERTVHRVRRGDTIGKIARRYGVSIQEVKRWNGLRGNTIFPGQQIVILQ